MSPVEHSFRYRFFLTYLDLGELPEILDRFPLYSARRRAPARFRRADYLGDPARPLDECVRDTVAAAGAPRPTGPVRLLTGLRYLGHGFNPVSFYYCFDPTGRRVEAVVAEVENIPWGQRHAYVLERGDREGTVLSEELEKNHHVSPLMGMDQTCSFRAGTPGERLHIQIESRPREGGARTTPGADPTAASSGGTATATLVAAQPAPKIFDATLSLRRRELSRLLMLGLLARYPANSLQTVAKIYAQAARLKLKGARYYPHPEGAEVAR
jgi:hypothetical protein